MVIISTSAVAVSIQAVSPLSSLTGAAAAAAAAAGAAVCAKAEALAARLPIAAAVRRSEMERVKRIGNPPENGARPQSISLPTTQESCQAAALAVSAQSRRLDGAGG